MPAGVLPDQQAWIGQTMQKVLLLLCSTILASISSTTLAQSRVDMIAINGKIWTENAAQPEVEAVVEAVCAGGVRGETTKRLT